MTTQPKTTEAENPYLTREDALAILNTPDDQLDELIARAEKLRRKYKGDNVGIHILTNARSGNCSQDCAYCAQSCRSSADIEKYKWVSDEKLYRDNDFVNKNHLARTSALRIRLTSVSQISKCCRDWVMKSAVVGSLVWGKAKRMLLICC